jgi:nicotinamide-nucleotide amidase
MSVCEILSVGTEILLGDILNTNSRFLSRALANMGISVLYHETVGDNEQRLYDAVKRALGRSDIVITTGGLGPTPDDITRDVCTKAFGYGLVFRPELANQIKEYFDRSGRQMAESNLRQAYAPEEATVFRNHNGTAPGLGMKKDGKCLVLLPGPPFEAEPMFRQSVVPFLEEYRTCTIVSHQVRTMGIGESSMAQIAGELLDGENPTVAPYCKTGEAYLRVSARAATAAEADRLSAPVINEIEKRLGEYIYGIDVNGIEEAAVPLLKEAGLTVAVAESCTAGLVAKRITDVPGASKVFHHGIITYSNDVKIKALGVNPGTLRKHGAVSEETATEMAQGVRKVSGADIGISVTGFAGPDSDEPGKAPGLIYTALSAEGTTLCEKIETGRNDRDYNRFVASSRALNLLRRYLISIASKENTR